MVTGAGANKVSEVIGCQWQIGQEYVEALANTGVILKAPASTEGRAGNMDYGSQRGYQPSPCGG